jgi:glycosyltransferase involved in cell wall biosynthesis
VSRKIHFFTNGIFSTSFAGGDMVFFNLARAAARAGYEINYFGGHAFQQIVAGEKLPGRVTLTDEAIMPKAKGGLGGQVALFKDFHGRYRKTMALLGAIAPEDYVCAASDYWFDVIPLSRSASQHKLMVLNMEAPAFGQIVFRSRPDVDAVRLSSLHYWFSQEWSLKRFAATPHRHMLYLHPLMEPRLDKLGIKSSDRTLISYGFDPAANDAVPAQNRTYDVVWIGRVHRQKGIDDLLSTLQGLKERFSDLRVLFIGNVKAGLAPLIEKIGLQSNVVFSGFVSEEEKIRLFKSSRVFLMPSKHEGSPRVIGESIIARTPVVAYDIPNYRPLFGNLVRYVPPFNLAEFQKAAIAEVIKMRGGENYLDRADLQKFRRENSWDTAQERFLEALKKVS